MSDKVTNMNLSDVRTCYKTFKREVLRVVNLLDDRLRFDQELTINLI